MFRWKAVSPNSWNLVWCPAKLQHHIWSRQTETHVWSPPRKMMFGPSEIATMVNVLIWSPHFGAAFLLALPLKPSYKATPVLPTPRIGAAAERGRSRKGVSAFEFHFGCITRSPSSALLPFFGGGFPYQYRLQKKGYPYSNTSTGGPR